MAVDGGGVHPEPAAQSPGGEPLQAELVDQGERLLEDALVAEAVAWGSAVVAVGCSHNCLHCLRIRQPHPTLADAAVSSDDRSNDQRVRRPPAAAILNLPPIPTASSRSATPGWPSALP